MKKRNAKVIQISGVKGLLLLAFAAVCLFVGFVIFPAKMLMMGWNYLAGTWEIPMINLFQGLLLWGFVAGSIYVLNDRKKYLTAFQTPTELNEEELRRVLDKVRAQTQAQMLNSMVLKASDFKKFEQEELKNRETTQKVETSVTEDIKGGND